MAEKMQYTRPVVEVIGSLEELTGDTGSNGTDTDAQHWKLTVNGMAPDLPAGGTVADILDY